MLAVQADRETAVKSARKYAPPGMEQLLESDYIFGWLDPEEIVYQRVLRHLLESGFLDSRPELKLQAEAALALRDLL
jgi:hypothetical protein